MNIVVTEYNPSWQGLYENEAKMIKEVLGDNLVQVFHIGSTAVAGLCAKPIIDIMPVVRSMEALMLQKSAFEALGYEVLGEFGIPSRCYMRKGGDTRTHQIHVFDYSSSNHIVRHLAFRDYLRCHAAAREEYAALKTKLAKEHPRDSAAYCDGKDEFVKQLEKEALMWHWAQVK